MFNKLWVSLLPFLQSVYALVSTLFCGNEHHNLIMICEKKYFLLFAMNLLPDNFSQCFLAFICDKENILCLCKVPGVSTLTRAGTALAGQVPSFYQWPSWEACLGVQSCTQPLVFMLKSTDKNSYSSPCCATWILMHKELPWTHELVSRRLLKSCLLKNTPCTIDLNWNLTDSMVKNSLSQCSFLPTLKRRWTILFLTAILIFNQCIKYKMQAICQGTYIYIWTLYIWSSIIFYLFCVMFIIRMCILNNMHNFKSKV